MKAFLDGHALDVHCFKKKMTMVTNSEVVMKEDSLVNLVTRLWTEINSSSILKCKLSKFIKLVKIACVLVLRFVKDECYFSTMSFIKNKLKNCLTCHLDLCICFYAQQFYNIENFHFEEAMIQ